MDLHNADVMQQQANNGEETPTFTKPKITVRVIRENMEAEMQLEMTGANTLNPTIEDLVAALDEKNVSHGVKQDVLHSICRNPSYSNPYTVAQALPPGTGSDGWIDFLFETKRELRPKLLEDGTADFKDIGFIQQVRKDQVLCQINPPEKGGDGYNVYGEVLEGRYGKEPQDPAGQNTYTEEDERGVKHLKAACDGDVDYKFGKVHVVDVLRIPGNIDNSTGDIHFTGDVIINGDVMSGFRVITDGDITVRGNVEGSVLEAGGNIAIGQNMNGMEQGKLMAGGDIKCKHIQGTEIRLDGNLYADTLLYCEVECGGNIELSGKRAALIGGKCSIAGYLIAKTIGTSTHVATEIQMCTTGIAKQQEAEELQKQVTQLDHEIGKLIQILTRYNEISQKTPLSEEQMRMVMQVKASYVKMAAQRKDTKARFDFLEQERLEASRKDSHIQCKDRVHTGTKISFGAAVLQVKESFVYSRIHNIDGRITVSPL